MQSTIDSIKNTLGENFGGAAHKLATHQFSLDETLSQEGKVAVVTGGSEGIGYGFTHTLLSKGIKKVYILSVSQEVVDGAKKAIAEELGQEVADRTHWLQCDLSDWPRVKEVAEEIKLSTDRLDILFNNASRGIMTYQLTDNGVDRHMAIGHFGHAILTSHLLPLMKKTADSGSTVRIVNQSSNGHQNIPKNMRFANLNEMNQDYGPMPQYGRVKIAGILYARWMNKHVTSKNPNILANATHPGVVSTKMSIEDIHEPYPLGGYGMSAVLQPFKKNQFEGAVSAVFAATTTKESGQYICPPAVPEPGSEESQNEELMEALMKLTREVVSEKTKSQSVDKGCPFTMA